MVLSDVTLCGGWKSRFGGYEIGEGSEAKKVVLDFVHRPACIHFPTSFRRVLFSILTKHFHHLDDLGVSEPSVGSSDNALPPKAAHLRSVLQYQFQALPNRRHSSTLLRKTHSLSRLEVLVSLPLPRLTHRHFLPTVPLRSQESSSRCTREHCHAGAGDGGAFGEFGARSIV